MVNPALLRWRISHKFKVILSLEHRSPCSKGVGDGETAQRQGKHNPQIPVIPALRRAERRDY